jgi:acyl-CoA thioesterase YciA
VAVSGRCGAADRDLPVDFSLDYRHGEERDNLQRVNFMAIEQPRGDLTVRTMAMPADTNANGDIFGGWVMSQMDQAGGIAGVERAQGRVVTVAVDAMHFIRPVRVGDVLCVYTRVERVGRTSMTIQVEAWARRFQTQGREKVTEATFTFVAIDHEGRPRAIPPAVPNPEPAQA